MSSSDNVTASTGQDRIIEEQVQVCQATTLFA